MPGEVIWWFGWPFGDLDGHSPAIPPVGRVKNARKTTAGAPGQAGRSGRTNPQLRAAHGARGCAAGRKRGNRQYHHDHLASAQNT